MNLLFRLSLFIFIKIVTSVEESEVLLLLDDQNLKQIEFGHVWKLNFPKSVNIDNNNNPKLQKLNFNDYLYEKSNNDSYNLDMSTEEIDLNFNSQLSDITEDEFIDEDSNSYITKLNVNPDIKKNKNLLCPPCKCGVKTSKRIVGGKSTASNKYSWIALLSYKRKFFCGGSLINDRFVITAGHCTKGIESENIQVYLNEYKRSLGNISETIIREVKYVYRPISYNHTTFNNDISLLKLNRPVDINSGLIRPICLPHYKSSFAGQNAIVTGWGLKYKRTIPASNLLRTQFINILSNQQCREKLLDRTLTSRMICGEYLVDKNLNTKRTCGGDTGGPLMVIQNQRQRLAGIISMGCPTKHTSGIFTRVTKFNGWIRKLSDGACWCD